MSPVRVLVADDHPFFRQGLRAMLEASPDTEPVAEAADGEQAIQAALEAVPDVVLMDLRMPAASGIEATRAIRTVAAGEAIFGAGIAARMVSYFAGAGPNVFPELTARERDVPELLAAGSSNQAIARELQLSLKTVRNHVSNVFNKLQVLDRGQAIVKAREAGLGRQRG